MKLELTKEQLTELEDLAACWFTEKEIALVLQVDVLELSTRIHRSGNTPEKQAFFRGRLRTEAETRQSVFEAAANGSGPAQALALKIIADTKLQAI